ncbi:MAG: allophanate hydrolase subunit 1 [Verrucomicrobia bacterium]|nr:allophanate hydrolase subunit 1 [Verrucomicrobiota bacterium]
MPAQALPDCQWLRYGPHAILLRWSAPLSGPQCRQRDGWVQALSRLPATELVEAVPSFQSLLLEFPPGTEDPMGRAQQLWASRPLAAEPPLRPLTRHLIPCRYDGPDLERVARWCGRTVQEVIELHAGATYQVECLGFSPGFAYLHGLPAALHAPRLETPRPRIPAGSVAIGGSHAGVYPSDSPGGWNILGHTTVPVFNKNLLQDPGRPDEAFLFHPGDVVRFVLSPG